MRELTEEGKVYCFEENGTEYFLHRKAESGIREEILEELHRYLQQYPYRLGMPEAQLQSGAPGRLKKAAVSYIAGLWSSGFWTGSTAAGSVRHRRCPGSREAD